MTDLGILAEVNYRVWSSIEGFVFKARIRFEDTVEFVSSTIFRGSLTVNTDTAGSVTIPAGATKVKINFNSPFEQMPVVNLTPVQKYNIVYVLEEVTNESFSISISSAQPLDTVFNWIALRVEGEPLIVEVLE